MLKPSDKGSLSHGVRKGISLHHAIDKFTDLHPKVAASKARIRPWVGKYAPVIIDVYFDLSIASRWPKFSSLSYDQFQTVIYDILENQREAIPFPLQTRVAGMVRHRWLELYSSWDGLEQVLTRTGYRSSNPDILIKSIIPLRELGPELDADFDLFWPELTTHVNSWVLQNPWLRVL